MNNHRGVNGAFLEIISPLRTSAFHILRLGDEQITSPVHKCHFHRNHIESAKSNKYISDIPVELEEEEKEKKCKSRKRRDRWKRNLLVELPIEGLSLSTSFDDGPNVHIVDCPFQPQLISLFVISYYILLLNENMEGHKKVVVHISNVKVFTVDPYFGVTFLTGQENLPTFSTYGSVSTLQMYTPGFGMVWWVYWHYWPRN